MRTIRFKNGVICKVHKDYNLIPLKFNFECATRILLNLKNLTINRKFMIGPLDYFGCLEPDIYYIIDCDLNFIESSKIQTKLSNLTEPTYITIECEWKKASGKLSKFSLFPNPGILIVKHLDILNIPINSLGCDYSSYNVKLVKNDIPFSFDNSFKQDKLRVVSYWFSSEYADYVVKYGDGHFLEKHKFVQSMTPMNSESNGFIMIGRRKNEKELDLIGIKIPFGYTIVINSNAIHGDSTFKGLYMMAMTSNHRSMAEADTVFLKNTFFENLKILVEDNVIISKCPTVEENTPIFNPLF